MIIYYEPNGVIKTEIEENKELKQEIEILNEIMINDSKVFEIMINETDFLNVNCPISERTFPLCSMIAPGSNGPSSEEIG